MRASQSCYGTDALQSWVERLDELLDANDDAYVFFNNDPKGCALANAVEFGHLATKAGKTVTRTPKKDEVHLNAFRPRARRAQQKLPI